MKCPRWNELEFVNYCRDGLSAAEKAGMEAHLAECTECGERFILSWELISIDLTAEDRQFTTDFLSTQQWKEQKEEIARMAASAVMRQKACRRRHSTG